MMIERVRPRREQLCTIPIDHTLCDRNLLGAALRDAGTWETWLTVLRAAAGLPLNE